MGIIVCGRWDKWAKVDGERLVFCVCIMPCSKCKKDGHNRATCVEPDVPVVEQASNGVDTVPSVVMAQDIELPTEIRTKLRELAAMCSEVGIALGKGNTESVYQHALCIELRSHGISYGFEVTMPVMYKGNAIPYNTYRLDIILYDYLPFIFELKAMAGRIKKCDHWQLVRYMEQQKKQYGMVVNYSQSHHGPMEINVIIHHEGNYKLYDLKTGKARTLADYGYAGDVSDYLIDSDSNSDEE